MPPVPRHHFGSGSRRPSLRSRVATAAVRELVRPALRHVPISPLAIRVGGLVDLGARMLPVRTPVRVEAVTRESVRCEIVRAAGVPDGFGAGAVLYFHGGGFVAGGLHTHRRFVAELSRATGLPVVQVRYRYLPEATVPESVRDCLAAYRWLLEHGADSESVVFAGDSAGGFLTMSTALAVGGEQLPAPAAVVAISPWLDLDLDAKLAHRNAMTEAYLPTAAFTRIAELGCTRDGRIDTRLSPVNGDLSVLPSTLLTACDDEFLRLDSDVMAAALDAAGVRCELHIWYGQIHAFPVVFPYLPESRQLTAEIARFIREHVRSAASSAAA
ncbi:alpha/beta hydrolase [Nocardia aurantiaca]|uniref:Alpha/beta hydrolase fold domain-containing protein n=1 Tax=Nocardia aurantiaca TaxID=2675850 RepID=A0A6I3KTK4_9NOCA|nr:alpha/beta hydrolase [Nocardia aurantiaca]MTE11424.1 alpha/beta hydrolase fold domain-containing protein [Nocardia aurantiaca]